MKCEIEIEDGMLPINLEIDRLGAVTHEDYAVLNPWGGVTYVTKETRVAELGRCIILRKKFYLEGLRAHLRGYFKPGTVFCYFDVGGWKFSHGDKPFVAFSASLCGEWPNPKEIREFKI